MKVTKRNAPDLWACYLRLTAAGKTRKEARVALARKLVRLAWVMLTRRKPYALRFPSPPSALSAGPSGSNDVAGL
jgi:hypothetical protein